MCAPIRAVIHIREVLPHHGERDLLYVRAVGVGRVDTLAAIDEHAENDPSAIRRPSGPECEIWSGNLQIDVGVTASVRVDREYLSVPQFPDNLCPIRRKARRRGDSRKVQLTCRRELTKTRAVRVLDEQCALKVGCCVIGVPLHAFPHKQKLSPIR